MIYEGDEIYIFTQPVGQRQYNLAVVCPANDINAKYADVHWFLLSSAEIISKIANTITK